MTAAQIKRQPIVFGNNQQSGHEPLAGASPLAVNVVLDAAGAVHRRPALGERRYGRPELPDVVSFDSPIVALHSTATGRLFAVDAATPFSRIYEIVGEEAKNLSTLSGTQLEGGRRPIIAETEAILAISAGGPPMKVVLGIVPAVSQLGGGPPHGSHVIATDQRLLMNDVVSTNPNTVRYSATASGSSYAGHESWAVDIEDLSAGGAFTAAARPDPVVAVHENTNEVFVFGTTNLQIFVANPSATDPAKDFVFVPSNAREFGCAAPYSIVKYDQSFAYIDGHRRIVLTDGRDFQIISQNIQQTLDDIADLSDAYAYRVTTGPVNALCWGLPRDGRTFVYQIPTKSWSIWQGWNDETNNFAPLPIRCAIRVPETGEMLAGFAILDVDNTVKGGIAVLDNHTFKDAVAGKNGRVVARVDTGYIDRDTSGRKLCRALRLTWRGTPSTDTAAWVQWRDDDGPWEHQRQIEIGHSSETILRALGVYRRRQWRIIFEGEAELVLARAEEEYETLSV